MNTPSCKRRTGIAGFVLTLVAACAVLRAACLGADWPSFGGDPGHSGVAHETLSTPLRPAWVYRAMHPPSPAFQGGLAPKRTPLVESITYDYVFQPVVADGRLYFGSSTEEAVFCLDATTGQPKWVFRAEGAVRIAPSLWQGRVYFGSDDGHVYCLDGATGQPIWTFQAAPTKRRSIGNGRIISEHPVRTEVAIVDGVAYFGAGLFPPLGVYLHAVDAESGKPVWRQRVPYSLHGQIVADGEDLLVATGRTCPAEFRRKDGTPRVEEPGPRRTHGGSFLGRLNDMLLWGPDESGVTFLRVSEEPIPDRKGNFRAMTVGGRVTGLKAHAMVADERVYLIRDDDVLAVDWKTFSAAARKNPELTHRPWDKAPQPRYGPSAYGLGQAGALVFEDRILRQDIEQNKAWSVANEDKLITAILAGEKLIGGGSDKVVLFDAKTGTRLEAHAVEGEARGLAVAGDALYVSTDAGRIYCFRSHAPDRPARHELEVASPYEDDPRHAEVAEIALRHADTRKGFALVLGVGTDEGQRAYEIAERSQFFVVAIDKDAAKVEQARRKLTQAGVYGRRVVVYHVPEEEPPLPDHFANLIVAAEDPAESKTRYALSGVFRLLQPYGGTIVTSAENGRFLRNAAAEDGLTAWQTVEDKSGAAWRIAHRKALPGAGEWTQMYANPGNTGCSGDRLVGAEHRLQWFGPPGADDVVERHALAHPPLCKDGRIFMAGLFNTVRAVDAYNGTRLWKIEVPASTRMEMSHSAAFLAAGREALFAASGKEGWMIDPATGDVLHKFAGPRRDEDWGYIGTLGAYLLGTSQKPPADRFSYGEGEGFGQRGYRVLVSAKDLHSRPTVSTSFFVYDIPGRKLLWTYDPGGVILNPTIAAGDGTAWFVESRNPQADPEGTGTAGLADFFAQGAALVALDLETGQPTWRKPLGPLSGNPADKHEHIAYLSYCDGHLLLARTGHLDGKLGYVLQRLSARDGTAEWTQTIRTEHNVFAPLNYGKNGQQSHPVIVGGSIFLVGLALDAWYELDWETGGIRRRDPALFDWWSHSKTCAVPTASASGLYFRRNSSQMYDIASGRPIDLTRVTRPGCWMSIIPAGGLVLMPEASSGCTCGFALQTSVVLAPPAYPR